MKYRSAAGLMSSKGWGLGEVGKQAELVSHAYHYCITLRLSCIIPT